MNVSAYMVNPIIEYMSWLPTVAVTPMYATTGCNTFNQNARILVSNVSSLLNLILRHSMISGICMSKPNCHDSNM